MRRLAYLLIISIINLGGSSTRAAPVSASANDLQKFALATCLLDYFESKGYDTSDIRAIGSGIVETSDVSIDQFQKIALAVRAFTPTLETKQSIDKKLLRCFYLENLHPSAGKGDE